MSDMPTWRDRLRACFSVDHRLLHVFGIPAILGVVAASLDLGGAENALAMILGGGLSALGVYLVTIGADARLNKRLFEEKREQAAEAVEAHYHELRGTVAEEIAENLRRVEVLYREIRGIFDKGEKDEVTQVLKSALGDVDVLRAKAYQLAELDIRLGTLLGAFDLERLYDEVSRHQRTIKNAHDEGEKKAATAALEACERQMEQMQSARARLSEVRSALSTIESNLNEFKVGIELRKADALIRQSDLEGLEDLGASLKATGSACDEILGGGGSSASVSREEEEAALKRVREIQAQQKKKQRQR